MSIMLHGRRNDLAVGAELLRGIPQCMSKLLHGRQNDIAVGADLLSDIPQCIFILLHDRQSELAVGAELPRAILKGKPATATGLLAARTNSRSARGSSEACRNACPVRCAADRTNSRSAARANSRSARSSSEAY